MTEKNIQNDKPSGSLPSTQQTKKKFMVECFECDKPIDIEPDLYEMFLRKLYDEIEKMPDTYESKCLNCKSAKTLPSWRWGRYCDTPKCGYKLPGTISWITIGSCAEDICSMILEKFDDAVRCGKCGMPADHVFEGGWICPTNNCKI